MTIRLGQAVLVGSQVQIQPPGFGAVSAVRLTNYTADVIVLQDIRGAGDGAQEYLMPFQTMVYDIQSFRVPPKAYGVALGDAFSTASLFVEWSDDPANDFPGTYPQNLTEAPIVPQNSTDGVVVLAANATGAVAAGGRTSTTFYNNGPGVVYWSSNPTTVLGAGSAASLNASGAGVTLAGGKAVYLKADASGASVSFFGG